MCRSKYHSNYGQKFRSRRKLRLCCKYIYTICLTSASYPWPINLNNCRYYHHYRDHHSSLHILKPDKSWDSSVRWCEVSHLMWYHLVQGEQKLRPQLYNIVIYTTIVELIALSTSLLQCMLSYIIFLYHAQSPLLFWMPVVIVLVSNCIHFCFR